MIDLWECEAIMLAVSPWQMVLYDNSDVTSIHTSAAGILVF